MPTTRRQFLTGAATLALAPLLPRSYLHAQSPTPTLTDYITALETPYAAPLNLPFERLIGGSTVGLLLYEVNTARLLTALNPEKLFPVASAFKAPLLLYFLDQVLPDVWGAAPVQYWDAAASGDVPETYRESWSAHRVILRDLYRTLVFSDNTTTGAVLAYVAATHDDTEPIKRFNDWARETVGVSQLSGLSAWADGITTGMRVADARFTGSATTLNGGLVGFDNMMTPRDLGLFYMWMLSEMPSAAQDVARALLSTIYNNRGANLERLAQAQAGTSYSKNGSLQTDAGYVVADAGLMALPDGRELLLVVLSLDAPTLIPTLFEELDATLRGKHNDLLHNRYVNVITPEELLASYSAQVAASYTDQQTDDSGYHYGFILPSGVNVYRHPDEASILHNPVIKSTRFGIHLLMQGALVRYREVDREWVELLPDNDFDNVRSRLGTQVFVKRADVWTISRRYAEPIPYLLDADCRHPDKMVVIALQARELIAFEGATPVMRLPIVLNPDATPRGAQVITSKWFARSMQPWAPGVPFTAFFGAEGFALHGSPWQRWGTTVNQSNITERTSAGCVNIPDWQITIDEWTRPADELLFRWIGGMEQPADNVYEYPSEAYPALRIFVADYPQNLLRYTRSEGMIRYGLNWADMVEQLEALPLMAPDSFFV